MTTRKERKNRDTSKKPSPTTEGTSGSKQPPENSAIPNDVKLKPADRNALVIGIVGSVLTLLGLILSVVGLSVTHSYNTQSQNLESAKATFEANTRATSVYQADQQMALQNTQAAFGNIEVGLQQTQVAINLSQANLAKQQQLPYMEILSSDNVLSVNRISSKFSVDDQEWIIEAVGTLDITMANNGGVQTGLWNIQWENPENQASLVSLRITETQFGGQIVTLPELVKAQTPIKLSITTQGSVSFPEGPSRKSDYQLGNFWAQEIRNAQTKIIFLFSNNAPLSVTVTDIKLEMPITSYSPSPPSPFVVTNADVLGQVSFNLSELPGQMITAVFVRLGDQTKSETINIRSGESFSFPVGEYKILWNNPETPDRNNEETFSVQPDRIAEVELLSHSNIVGSPSAGLYLAGLVLFITGLVWGFHRITIETILVELFDISTELIPVETVSIRFSTLVRHINLRFRRLPGLSFSVTRLGKTNRVDRFTRHNRLWEYRLLIKDNSLGNVISEQVLLPYEEIPVQISDSYFIKLRRPGSMPEDWESERDLKDY